MADRIFDKNKPAFIGIYNNITSKPYSSVMVDNKADTQSKLRSENLSKCMRFPTMWYVQQAKRQIRLRIRGVWSEPLLVA